jgi:hypothetical protein
MIVVVPIDSQKIVEILFENSEQVQENVYLHIMNLMKQYHEKGDNVPEIRDYISKNLSGELYNKFKKYIEEPSDQDYSCIFKTIPIFIFLFIFSFFIYLIISRTVLND